MNKLIINDRKFKGLVATICRNIMQSGWQPDYVVGITRGGLLPAVMISQYFNIPCETLKISLRDSEHCESNSWMAEDAFGYIPEENRTENGGWKTLPKFRKNILVVDDINDSGATLNWLIKDWTASCLPDNPAWQNIWNENVKFATVVDNLASKCVVKMDYTGMEVNKAENDVWIEFPYEEWWTK